MNRTAAAVRDIPILDHDEAMTIAQLEYDRLLDAVGRLQPADWAQPTDCTKWDVKALLSHLLGMVETFADQSEQARQMTAAGSRAQETGATFIDSLTAIQVEEHSTLTTEQLSAALRSTAPQALEQRMAAPVEVRASTYYAAPPYDEEWTRGYLIDVIHTRDVWMHRIDIARATGSEPVLTPEHDGRLVADVVAEWARRHGQPFNLTLRGSAGGTFIGEGDQGEGYDLDAVEFCRILSGRSHGEGLLRQEVPF
jgi:uncharacterized protein (TIGR03083 family)